MANPEHLAKLRGSVSAWNEWRKTHTEIVPDFFRADLKDAHLERADLRLANLRAADLRSARLTHANLAIANLTHANLRAAHLDGTTLQWANFFGSNLFEADFSGSALGGTIFGGSDLSETKGLDTVYHKNPSTIGVDTIYLSQGRIPLAFMRGAGVPENFIQNIPHLLASGAIPFYSCFISYSTKDQEFADRLYADLQNKGVRCWFAKHDLQGGKYTIDQIDNAIRMHERVLLILSSESMKSKWVETEIVKARKREVAEKMRVLFPVGLAPFDVIRDWKCFDSDTGEDLAREIRKYFIPDFSEWKNHDWYAEGFKNLLRDLKTGSNGDLRHSSIPIRT